MNTLPAELVAIVASHVDDIDSITGLCDAAGIAPDGKGPDGKGPDANYMDEMYSEKLARLDFVEPEPTEKKTLVQTPRFFSRLCRHPCDPANHLSEQTSSNFVTYTKSAQSWETYKKHAREQLMALLADQEEWHQYRTPLQILRAQIYGFVHYISNAHSWYKHISLLESTRRRAGQSFTPTFDLVVNMHQQDGKYTKKERGDGSEFHYTWRTTDAYRSAFNFLSYESRISSEDSDASPTPPVDSNGTQACAPRSFLMKEVAVTSAVHEATTGYYKGFYDAALEGHKLSEMEIESRHFAGTLALRRSLMGAQKLPEHACRVMEGMAIYHLGQQPNWKHKKMGGDIKARTAKNLKDDEDWIDMNITLTELSMMLFPALEHAPQDHVDSYVGLVGALAAKDARMQASLCLLSERVAEQLRLSSAAANLYVDLEVSGMGEEFMRLLELRVTHDAVKLFVDRHVRVHKSLVEEPVRELWAKVVETLPEDV